MRLGSTGSRWGGGGRGRVDPLEQLAAPRPIPADTSPLWLTFPALAPVSRQRRLRTTEHLEHLERLAAPRPEPREPTTPLGGRPFRPELAAPWSSTEGWEDRLLAHLEIEPLEAERWFKEARGNGKGKSDPKQTDVLQGVRDCGHSELEEDSYRICKWCKKRICRDCWEKPCQAQQKAFANKSDNQRATMLCESLGIKDWEARVLMKNNVPVIQRLTKKSMKRSAFEYSSDDEAAYSSFSKAGRKSSPGAFKRLTTPRTRPTFNAIPYLPALKAPLPLLNDIHSAGGDEPIDDKVDRLEKEGKISAWQAGALHRCAIPVFDRLSARSDA
mmetsp:Transcript_100641/g.215712  ORF Transcript_100641/g.215712 Transcript_100641/m.215712 type:complete len:329 (+) Transcript_100641:99-1085(+)